MIGEMPEPDGDGTIVVATGGTSDMPIAEEAALTAEALGNKVTRLYDVGVSGVHRLLHNMEPIMSARCIVAVAGMEGALPSVIGGLADCPVIAVPTSVGYGASLGGVAALLSMLNSCASGVSVVNIDNGFGGGYLASMINHLGTARKEYENTVSSTSPRAPRATCSARRCWSCSRTGTAARALNAIGIPGVTISRRSRSREARRHRHAPVRPIDGEEESGRASGAPPSPRPA